MARKVPGIDIGIRHDQDFVVDANGNILQSFVWEKVQRFNAAGAELSLAQAAGTPQSVATTVYSVWYTETDENGNWSEPRRLFSGVPNAEDPRVSRKGNHRIVSCMQTHNADGSQPIWQVASTDGKMWK